MSTKIVSTRPNFKSTFPRIPIDADHEELTQIHKTGESRADRTAPENAKLRELRYKFK